MDMRIIEVAIGLVLVFAISSLLVSTLNEIWTGLRKSRGDSLLLGLCSLLGDDDVTMGQMRRRFSKKGQPSPFTRALLAHPLLVSQSLGAADKQRMPSYLPSDVFVSALISKLCEMATQGVRPADPQVWLNAVTANATIKRASGDAYQPKPALLGTLAALIQGVEHDWPSYELRLRAWYDGVQERAGGWYRRDTQLRLVVIGFLVAYMVNLNPLVIAPRLWNDPVMRAATVGLAQDAAKAYAAAASAPASAASASSAPSDSSLALLETMAKQLALAAPRSKAPAASAPVGGASAPAVAQTPQSLESEQAMKALKENLFATSESRLHPSAKDAETVRSSLDRLLDLQDQMRLRQRLASQGSDPITILDASIVVDDHLAGLRKQISANVSHASVTGQLQRLEMALRNERDAMLPLKVSLSREARGLAQRASLACVGDGSAVDKLCEPLGAAQQLVGSGLPIGWSWANWPACDAACQARQQVGTPAVAASASPPDDYARQLAASRAADPTSSVVIGSRQLRKLYQEQQQALVRAQTSDAKHSMELTPFLWRHWDAADLQQGLWQALLGWLIIGIAASLGAPFWFDLLGQFAKLRGSGTPSKPGTKDDGTAASPPDTMTRAPVPAPAPGPSPVGAAAPLPPAPDTGALNAAERDLDSAQIVRLQRSLGLTGTEATGSFDHNTRLRIVQWQQDRREGTSNGELSAAQIGALLSPAATPAATPGAPASATATPVRANGTINVLTETEVRALFGDIATTPLANGAVRVVSAGQPGQAQHQIVPFNHALLAGPQHVHARAHPHFVEAFNRIQAAIQAGTVPANVIVNCGGTFVPRHIDSNPSRPLSRHTWGIAIDLNTQANAMNAQPAALGQAGSLLSIVPIFNACGFAWGGHFTTGPDGMHFELALRNP